MCGGRIRVSLPIRATLLIAWLCSFGATAEIMSMNSSVRALGMGDAFTTLTDDSSALFYNPAGLAKVAGINWKVFGLRVGASGYEAISDIQNLQSDNSGDFSSAINNLYGKSVWAGAGGSTAIYLPMFAFSIYNHMDALIRIDNPVYPELYTSVINDYGYALGVGVPVGPFLQTGLALKYIKRTGARVPFGASFVADLDPSTIMDNVTGWGVGYAADAGINVVIPAPFVSATFSAVWKNMGETRFRSDNEDQEIPSEPNDITLGGGLVFDFPLVSVAPAVDIRYLNNTDVQLMRKFNFGIEIGLPLLDIRGGFREGYYTAGVGVNLGLFQVDVATYGVELGDYPGQIEDRRYALEFTMDLGVGNFTAPGVQGKGSSSSTSARSKSIWGGRRLKQRR